MPPPSLRQLIDADLFRYAGRLGTRPLLRSWWKDPGFRFLYHLRHMNANAPRRRSTTLLPFLLHRTILRQLRFRYGYDIAPVARIGPGLYIGHFGTVVISGQAVIGCDCNLAQGVTLTVGRHANPGIAHTGAPTLGDRVWVGPNAILSGPITVGSDVLIAPGAVVDFDVPPHAVVRGNPAVISEIGPGSAGCIANTLDRATAPERHFATS